MAALAEPSLLPPTLCSIGVFAMMNCMGMSGDIGGMMMLAMGTQWILFLVLAVLAVAALWKYLRSSPR
jgi:membrane protein implicated in regulation of membrane protease activity